MRIVKDLPNFSNPNSVEIRVTDIRPLTDKEPLIVRFNNALEKFFNIAEACNQITIPVVEAIQVMGGELLRFYENDKEKYRTTDKKGEQGFVILAYGIKNSCSIKEEL